MSLTNPQGKTRLFGFSLPNLLIYGLMALVAFVLFKAGKIITSLFNSIASKFGLTEDKSTEDNKKEIDKIISKDAAVLSQMNLGTRVKADQIEAAMQGFGIDIDTIYEVFKSITGPNQMKAVYSAYGTRTISNIVPFLGFKGDLIATLNWRLWDFQVNKKFGAGAQTWSIASKLKWITK